MNRFTALLILATFAVAAHASDPTPPVHEGTRTYQITVKYDNNPAAVFMLNALPGVPATARIGTAVSYVKSCVPPSPSKPMAITSDEAYNGYIISVNASSKDDVSFDLLHQTISDIKTAWTVDGCASQTVHTSVDRAGTPVLGIKAGASVSGLAAGKFVVSVKRGQDI